MAQLGRKSHDSEGYIRSIPAFLEVEIMEKSHDCYYINSSINTSNCDPKLPSTLKWHWAKFGQHISKWCWKQITGDITAFSWFTL